MEGARVRSAWLRVPLALAFVLPVYALHLFAPRLTGTRGMLIGALLSAAIAAVLGWAAYRAYVVAVEQRAVTEFDPRGAPRELAAGFVLGAAFFTATIGTLAGLGVYRIVGRHDLAIVVAPLLGAIGTAVIEEILFRGIVFRIVESALGTWLAFIVSSALFGLLHLVNPQATLQGAVAIAFEAGVMLAAAYVLTRRALAADRHPCRMELHAGRNLRRLGVRFSLPRLVRRHAHRARVALRRKLRRRGIDRRCRSRHRPRRDARDDGVAPRAPGRAVLAPA